MKFEYIAETPKQGPKYIMRATDPTGEEMRFLTILRDLANKPGLVIRVVGAEVAPAPLVGQPPNPVTALSIIIEKKDGSAPRAAELLAAERAKLLDPSQPVPRGQEHSTTEHVRDARRKHMRIVQREGGKGTVVEEDHGTR
jgi:hypothetical protein